MKEVVSSSMDSESKTLFEKAIELIQKDKKLIKEGSNKSNDNEFVEIMKQMDLLQKKISEKSKGLVDNSKLKHYGNIKN